MELIPLSKVKPPKIQLRPVRKESLDYLELYDSIRKSGVLQPILVRPLEGCYEVVEGNWRYHAALNAGLTAIPCLIKDMTDEEVEVAQLQLNAIRPKTRMAEYAKRLKELMERRNLSLSDMVVLVNKGAPWIRKILSLTKLESKARKMVDRGEISIQNATALARLPRKMQENFLAFAVTETAKDFTEMTRAALQDYRQCCQQDRTAWSEHRASHAVHYWRQMAEVREEAETFKAADAILARVEATTPMDGWRAALAWMLHLDPISLDQQNDKEANYINRKQSYAQQRKDARLFLENLTNRASNNEQ